MGANILLALGAMMMFSTFLGSSNRVMIGNNQLASQNEYYIAALSYGQSVIDEAKTKSFQGTITLGKVTSPSPLIGPETKDEMIPQVDFMKGRGFESGKRFDDVDDYNGYTRRVDSPRAEGYMISASVGWVEEKAPNTPSAVPTDAKRMVIKITSPYFPKIEKEGVSVQDTLLLSYVFTR